MVKKQLQYTYCPISYKKQPGNENWSDNKTSQEEYFSSKNMQKVKWGD